MKVTKESQVMKAGEAAKRRQQERTAEKSRNRKNAKSVFAGDLGVGQDRVLLRKQRAQSKALKIIGDAWNSDRKYDQSIQEIQDKCASLREEIAKNRELAAEGEAHKKEIMEQYGITDEDLALLSKKGSLSEEEKARLAELEEKPLSEFQQRYAEVKAGIDFYKAQISDAEEEIVARNAAVRNMRLERLKIKPPMLKAKEQADKVMEQASKEIIGMLTEEAKENIEEAYEEDREKAKEEAEKKAEQEEKVEERREETEQMQERIESVREENREAREVRREQQERSREEEELLSDMAEAGMNVGGNVSDAKVEIKELLHKMKVLEEDLKGALMDEEI